MKLNKKEINIINHYRKHLWRVSRISISFDEALRRIILEVGEELEIIERDLRADIKSKKLTS